MAQGVKKGSIYSLIGQGGAAFFVFLFQAIAARMLGTARFGSLSLFYSLVLMFAAVLSSGINDTIVKNISFYEAARKDKEIRFVYRRSIFLFVIFSAILTVLVVIFLRYISLRFFDGKVIIAFEFLIGVLLFSIYRIFFSVIIGKREFHFVSLFLILQSMFLLIGVLVGLLFRKDVVTANMGIALSPIIPLILVVTLISRNGWVSFRGETSFIKGVNIFIIGMSILSFLDIFLLRLGPVLIKLLGGVNANFYNGLYSAIFMPLSFTRTITIALFTSLFPNISRAFGENNMEQVRRYVLKSTGLVLGIVTAVSIIFYFWGPIIVRIIYGSNYVVNRIDCVLISLVLGFYLLGRLNNRILIAGGFYRVSLFSIIASLSIAIIVSLLLKIAVMPRVEVALLAGTFTYAITQVYFIIFKSKFI